MEELPAAATRGEHERILLGLFRSGNRAARRFFEVRQRIDASHVVHGAVQLDATRGGVEAGLMIEAHIARFVLAVLELRIHERLLLQLLPCDVERHRREVLHNVLIHFGNGIPEKHVGV